ncbi:MAG: rod shape-determining protein [Caldisericota bacterium]|nr:rod shape-determining protein [Caldisericota bacterium]
MAFFSRDLAIDLGTANTVVYVKNKGVVLREPTIVATDAKTGTVLAVGNEAKKMAGRTPQSIIVTRPLRDGVIADFTITEKLLEYFIRKAAGSGLFARPRVLVGIPSGITQVEMKAVVDAALNAGAREAKLIHEPMAAAIGADLPVSEARGVMIVDIGGGTAEVAVISMKGVVTARSLRVAGDEMTEAIATHIRRRYNLLIGDVTAEEVKLAIGSAYPLETETTYEVRGRDLINGLPKSVEVTSEEIRDALKDPLEQILATIKSALELTPPELSADIIDSGIMLSGGGALIKGLDKFISTRTGILVTIAEDPLQCVAKGAGKVLENFDLLHEVLV